MVDNCAMEELLQAPMEGDVPNDVIKLMMFPYSLEGNARFWENASKTDDRIDKLADQILTLVDIFAKKVVTPAPVKAVEESCVTCGGAHAYYNCPNTNSNQPSVCAATGTYNQVAPQNRASNFMTPPGFAPNQFSTSGTLPSNTIPNLKGEIKAITTRSGVAYEGPSIPTPKKVVEQEADEATDKEQTNFQGSTAHIQPPVTSIPKPDIPKTLPKPNKPYPSRLNDQKLHEKAMNQMEKFFQIFQDLRFDISFVDALISMPKFASTIKSLLTNKDKLFELAKIPLNENCSAMLLKKLPEKLRDPGKFLIPFMDFEADPRGPFILGRSFLRNSRALIDVYGEEITLWVNDEAVTFNLNQTTRYSSTYDDLSVNRIDIIDVAREEYAQEILGFSNNSLSGNPTSTFEPILFDSSPSLTPPWVSPIHCVPKKCVIIIVENENNELIPTWLVTGWRVCFDYRKLNDATRKDQFPLPFMDQMLERLAGSEFYCFIDGFSGYFQIPINPPNQEKTTFTCPYGTFTYRRMPFGLCNAPGTFQRCMMAIFHDMIEKTMEVFMDDFLVFGDSFSSCLSHIDSMLQRCEDTNLVLNWEKCHFMVKERIFLGHKIFKNGLEVDRAKVDVIAKLPHPTTVKGVRSFLGHVSFYRRFIQDFSKIARPMTHLLEKETLFLFSKDCIDAFETLKRKRTEASILVIPDWNLPFKLMCDASDFTIGAVLGQRKTKHF
nr:reverse transcriptase domain-containing protein [Tanacetum cinerariifolium]